MGGFLHVQNQKPSAYVPFNEFTTTELGCERGNAIYSMVNVMPSPFAEEYLKIFNEQWQNSDKFKDVTAQVLEYIETVYNENAPEFIYFITLYNIFSEFLEDISEDVLPNEATGFRNSVIWNKLYNFQRDAALAIINKLESIMAASLPTPLVSAKPSPHFRSSSITRTATNPCLCFVQRSFMTTGTPSRPTTRTIRWWQTACVMTFSSIATSAASVECRQVSTSNASTGATTT